MTFESCMYIQGGQKANENMEMAAITIPNGLILVEGEQLKKIKKHVSSKSDI